MPESILLSVKDFIGLDESYTDFDSTIILLINAKLSILCDMGVGPADGFRIKDKTAEWDEFIPDKRLDFVRELVQLQVRLDFDPPQIGSGMEAMKETIKELQWRANSVAERLADENG